MSASAVRREAIITLTTFYIAHCQNLASLRAEKRCLNFNAKYGYCHNMLFVCCLSNPPLSMCVTCTCVNTNMCNCKCVTRTPVQSTLCPKNATCFTSCSVIKT